MAYSPLSTKTSANTNASADINQLDDNIEWIAKKQYASGTAYTNGTPSVTGTAGSFSIQYSALIPYRTTNGNIRIIIKVTVNCDAWTSQTVTISGVTFLGGITEMGSAYNNATVAGRSYTNAGTGDLTLDGVSSSNACYIFADFEITAWPTWAD